MKITASMIARLCHEAKREFQRQSEEDVVPPWDDCTPELKDAAISWVKLCIEKYNKYGFVSVEAVHDTWVEERMADGWVLSEAEDYERTTHPTLVPFAELDDSNIFKDYLFVGVVIGILKGCNKANVGIYDDPPPAPPSVSKSEATLSAYQNLGMDDSLKVTEEEYLSHTLSIRTPPEGSWDVHVNMTIMTDVLLKKIGYREDSGLGQLIHNLRWHQGLDPLLWIHENAELASKISKTYLSVPPGYAKLIRESIEILKDR